MQKEGEGNLETMPVEINTELKNNHEERRNQDRIRVIAREFHNVTECRHLNKWNIESILDKDERTTALSIQDALLWNEWVDQTWIVDEYDEWPDKREIAEFSLELLKFNKENPRTFHSKNYQLNHRVSSKRSKVKRVIKKIIRKII
jgi:hypothetical protein